MDKNKNAVALFDKLAQLYQSKYMNVDLYADGLDLFCGRLAPKAHVLELACGPGNVTRYLLDRRPDLKILGTDLAPNMVELAKTNNPEAQFEFMDCRAIGKFKHKYDAIVCAFCLPYLSKEETIRLIADAASILRPNGLMYLSTMEDDYSKSRLVAGSTGDTIFMHFHESGYLAEALQSSGLEIVHLERIQYKSGETDTTDLILMGKKQSV